MKGIGEKRNKDEENEENGKKEYEAEKGRLKR